jgi:hypothetical protein
MKIFQAEIDDGIDHKIATSSSIVYAALAEPVPYKSEKIHIDQDLKTLASYSDDDLYYVQSILVTSSWNKNDDIFDKSEVWAAKKTPEDKPTNLEHDESLIIGHITSNWPIDQEGNIIPDDLDVAEIPDKYHILTGSVIYRGFSQPELKERAEQLISEIENGTKYVSMECFFKGFDYGLRNKNTGAYQVLSRNDDTAHLTKYLRAYGGMGEHEDYQIGRVLRNITFSGKGFVNKPANPESIIFSKNNIVEKKNDDLIKTGVSMNKSTSNMEIYEMSANKETVETTENEELVSATTVVEESVSEIEQIKQELEAAVKQMSMKDMEMKKKDEEMKKKEEMATKMKAEFDEQISVHVQESEAAMKNKNEEMKKKDEQLEKMKAEVESLNEVLAGYKKQEEEMAKKAKMMKRMAALTEAGVSEEVAASAVETFENIDDTAFEAIANMLVSQKKTDVELTEETVPEPTVDASVLENVEVEQDINLGVGSEDSSDVNSTRAELLEFVCARLGKKLNKGE